MKLRRILILCLWMLGTMGVEAQISDAIRGLFKVAGDSAVVADSVRTDIGATGQDSALVVQLRRSLEEARSNEDSLRREFEEAKLNEANLRMEFEQFKLNILAGDSIKRQRQMSFIDSLRKTTKGSPVMVDGDTLFNLYTKKGGQSAMQRAQETGELMELIGKRINLDPGKVYVENTDIFSDIMYGTEVLVSFTDADAMWEGMSRDSLVSDRKQVVVDKFQQMKRQYGIWRMVKRVLYCLLVLIVLTFLQRIIRVNAIKRVEVRFIHRNETLSYINKFLSRNGVKVLDVDFHVESKADGQENPFNVYTNVYTLHLPARFSYTDIVNELSEHPNIQLVRTRNT